MSPGFTMVSPPAPASDRSEEPTPLPWAKDFCAPEDEPYLPALQCPNCSRPIVTWRNPCPHCWPEGNGPQPISNAIPVAPPRDDLPVAYPVDDPSFAATSPDDIPDALPVGTLVALPAGRQAAIPVEPPVRRRRREAPRPSRLGPLFTGYALMMGITLVWGMVLVAALVARGSVSESEQNWGLMGCEAAFTLLVFGAAVLIGRLPPHPTRPAVRTFAWVGSLPVLGVLLTLNLGFAMLVRRLLGTPAPLGPELTVVTVLLTCVQPAVVEEWFFRHLALGSLREPVGVHGAVLISGVMFGVAHLLNPIGIPYLILLGVCLGYLRVLSGSLVLPMALHFVHNAAVLVANRMI